MGKQIQPDFLDRLFPPAPRGSDWYADFVFEPGRECDPDPAVVIPEWLRLPLIDDAE